MFKVTSAAHPADGGKAPKEYIDLIEDPERKSQIKFLDEFIRKTIPNLKPFILSGMIGYGKYKYKSKSGREGDWAVVALASQKNYISIYACGVIDGKYVAETFKKDLPKADIGKSCIRIKKIEDLDLKVLSKILRLCEKYPMGKI